jgi:mannose-1-phosphate guanylyltransferase
MEIHAVIMAGGSGTRFWPASREARPKQLLALGRTDEALLTATARRISSLVPPDHVHVVTNARLRDATLAALPGVPAGNVLLEPVGRNTAPCVAWATATVARRAPDAVVAVLPADQAIADEAAFVDTLRRAVEQASLGTITTIGIVPTRPETGYGYIEAGDDLPPHARRVVRFVEKPDRARAEAYLAGGRHVWNAGMFFFRASDMLREIARHLPDVQAGISRIDEASATPRAAEVLREVFPALPSISIDHGVMEKAEALAVVPGDFGWSDVGSWDAAWDLAAKDAAGNAGGADDVVFVDASGNLVRALEGRGRMIALVGVKDLVVVQTDDAVLVIPKDRAQDVRAVVEELKRRGRADLV